MGEWILIIILFLSISPLIVAGWIGFGIFILWIALLMAAVVAACAIYTAGESIVRKAING